MQLLWLHLLISALPIMVGCLRKVEPLIQLFALPTISNPLGLPHHLNLADLELQLNSRFLHLAVLLHFGFGWGCLVVAGFARHPGLGMLREHSSYCFSFMTDYSILILHLNLHSLRQGFLNFQQQLAQLVNLLRLN